MTVRAFGDHTPRIAPTAWVSEAAYVVGDVTIGENSSVWPGAVVRGDFCSIFIGVNTHIEDNCVIHGGDIVELGDNIISGHGVIIHCRKVGSNCLLGNNATLLDGAVIGDECLVAAGAVVLGGTTVPDGSFVAGMPATFTPASERHLRQLRSQGVDTEHGYAGMARRYRELGL